MNKVIFSTGLMKIDIVSSGGQVQQVCGAGTRVERLARGCDDVSPEY